VKSPATPAATPAARSPRRLQLFKVCFIKCNVYSTASIVHHGHRAELPHRLRAVHQALASGSRGREPHGGGGWGLCAALHDAHWSAIFV
jgi:hypothetical protein